MSSETSPNRRAGVHLNCPHCHNPIEILDVSPDDEILCPSCGSSFHLDADRTQSWSKERLPQLGKFELIEAVGRGAFGTVYRALDKQLQRTVAVKVPRSGQLATDEDEDRFVREARNAAQLQHSGIVSVYEVGRDEACPYIVSEFVDGITLSDALTAKRFSFRDAAQLVAQVATALQHAHAQGVVHRDLKPSNIMLTPEGVPRVMDFGLAKRDAGEITMTAEGEILGTPAYMSPEQASGQAHHVDGRSDVYSLGSIFYQLLTGELPFRGNQRMLLHQVLHDEPRSPRSLNDRIPRDLETICLKAMAKEPGRRYESAQAMADDLDRYLHGLPILARPVGQFEKAWRWTRRNPLVASLSVAIVLLLALVTALATFAAVQASKQAREQTLLAIEAMQQRERADENARLAEENARLARKTAGEDVQNVRTAVAKALEMRSSTSSPLASNAGSQSNYEDVLATIEAKVDLIESLLNTRTKPSDSEISTLFNDLIEQPIAAAEKVPNKDAKFNRQLARLYYMKCRVIRQFPDVAWLFMDKRHEAASAIELAVKLDPGNFEYLVERGNAYEDLAWLAKVSVNENYERAIHAFTEAITERPDLPDAWVGRGRCYYKREADSRQTGKGYMDRAVADLSQAVSLDKKEQNTSARYWLGKAYLYRAKSANPPLATAQYLLAEQLLSKAVELGKRQASPDTPTYVVAWIGSRLDDDSFPKEQIRKQVNLELNAADVDAPGNRTYRNQLHLILGKSYERAGDLHDQNAKAAKNPNIMQANLMKRNRAWEDGLGVYDEALGPDPAKAGVFDVTLLKARARLRLALQKNVTACEHSVRDADAVLRILGSTADFDAYYVAAETHYALAKAMSVQWSMDSPKVVDQFKHAIDAFEQMIPRAGDNNERFDAYLGHALAIDLMVKTDPSLVAAWRPKAKESIDKALNVAPPGLKKTQVQNWKDQIDKL